MKIRLLTNQLKSGSLRRVAEGLSKKLGYKIWRSSKQKPGCSHLLYGDCKGKIEQYIFFAENGIPALEFTTNWEQARAWAFDGTVVGRRLTHSSEGNGIELFGPDTSSDDIDSSAGCPVYTKYKKKKKEFRVHIFKDKVVHVLEKRRKQGWQGEDTKIRNTANGYVFCSENVEEPEGIRELALKASKVTKSDFKGVDIGYNEKKNELFVIECNSAPGIEGSNVDRYVKAIVECLT